LERGDRGINQLDEACRVHDIAYSQYKDLADNQKAKAWERIGSKDSELQ